MKKNIIITGGGTGGHIFPAISIANAIKQLNPEIQILFVGAEGRMEMEKVPEAGYPILGLPVTGFQRKASLKIIRFLLNLSASLRRARRIIREYNPDLVVGVGGYASGPMVRMANRFGIPTVIQEQNSYAGVTNRLLAKKAQKIFVAYEGMEKYFPKEKIILAGNPIRKSIEMMDYRKDEVKIYFSLDKTKKTLFITGGSLGAGSLNKSVMNHLDSIMESEDVQVIWQTGKHYYPEIKKMMDKVKPYNVKYFDFIERVELAFLVADLVIARAGALTISELSIIGKPVIFVPSPNVAEDHQTKNAMALVNKGAAVMIKDEEAPERLIPEALKLLKDEVGLKKLSENIRPLGFKGSATLIAKEILSLIK